MNQRLVTIILMSIFVMMQLQNVQVFAQETPQYFQQTLKTADNCPVSRLYASRMYIPVMIKEFHDPTPNWQVTSVSLTNNTNSLAQMNGDDKYAFLISTNSTDQFNFRTVASYTDGQEHQIFVEYWSQNEQIAIEQFSTLKGYFCRDFMVDTAIAPPQPDIGKAIQESQAGTFQQLINAVLEAVATVNGLIVIVPAAMGIFVIILIVFLIYHRSGEHNVKEMLKKINFISNEQQKTMRENKLIAQHVILSEKARDENQRKSEDRIGFLLKGVNAQMLGWSDQFTNSFRSMLMETKLFNKEQVEKIEVPKFEPIVEEPKEIETIIPQDIVDIPTKAPESIKEKTRKVTSFFSIRKKKKEEPVVKTLEQWKQFFIEKKLTVKQAQAAYSKLEPYVQKNYKDDPDNLNKLNALFEIAYGDMTKK